MNMYATFWALVPAIVAIALALITKEVYSSLFVGITVGALFYSGFNLEKTVLHIFNDGIVGVLTDSYNVGILVFLVILGTMVALMNKAGGSAAFGKWAGDLYTTPERPYANASQNEEGNANGKVIDLLIPIISLAVCCVIGMIYTGGFFAGTDFVTAFSQSDASVGLALGSFFGMLITIVLYVARRVLSFRKCMECLPEGFKAMVPAILILTFAWTLKAMTDSLGAKEYVAGMMESAAGGLMAFLPAIIFLVGCLLAFATGTSWGTFGILIPIVVAVFANTNEHLMVISISACMAGAVCGDHCSPISDTTIMASAGARCEHVNHVSTQLPYALVAAGVSFVSYVIAGFVQNAAICLIIAVILMIGTLLVLRQMNVKRVSEAKEVRAAERKVS